MKRLWIIPVLFALSILLLHARYSLKYQAAPTCISTQCLDPKADQQALSPAQP